MQTIITTQPQSIPIGCNELTTADSTARFTKQLAAGVILMATADTDVLWTALAAKPPVFIRHIMPVHHTLPVTCQEGDLLPLADAALALGHLLGQGSFSVQTRLLGERFPYTASHINNLLAERLTAMGLALNVKEPESVLSVVCTDTTAYLGVGTSAQQLSRWPGGNIRFAAGDERISRAEFKLLEAADVFGLELFRGWALDLGAAPGGFTRVLRQMGNSVVAIDPAVLDERLADDPQVVHHKITAQAYFATQPKARFGVIVNDMKMDYRESVHIMLQAADYLQPDGVAIMTLKLPQARQQHNVQQALEMLGRKYVIKGARQLFHNRSEVTVACLGK